MSVVTDHVEWFRTKRTSRYIDTITITDSTSRGTWNRATKQYDTPTTSTVYSGTALIRPVSATTKNRGEQGEVLFTHTIQVPFSVDSVAPGNIVTVTVSVYDDDLTGATLTVQSVEQDSYLTHRELHCLLSQGGGDRG